MQQGPGKAESDPSQPSLLTPVRANIVPAAAKLCNLQTCGNMGSGSKMLAYWPINCFILRHCAHQVYLATIDVGYLGKDTEFSDHFLLFCFCPI